MTRDEAVNKVIAPDAGYDYEHALIDTLADLGLLKLDEPLESRQSPTYAAYEALFDYIPSLDFMGFRALLRAAKLEVTRSPQENADA